MLAKARRAAGKQRVIFWFNVSGTILQGMLADRQGGPGCSSFDGSLMEVGPFRTVPASQTESGKVELKLVEGGWEEYANVVFGGSSTPDETDRASGSTAWDGSIVCTDKRVSARIGSGKCRSSTSIVHCC